MLPTGKPAPSFAPAVHICRTCDVQWRDYCWNPSPCWSCGQLAPVAGGANLMAPVQTRYHSTAFGFG